MEDDKSRLITVFSSNNTALFQVAKSVLENYKIKFFATGEFLNPMEPAVYGSELKVFDKDEKRARELLSDVVQTEYVPADEFEKKLISHRWYWYVGLLILMVFAILLFLSFLNK